MFKKSIVIDIAFKGWILEAMAKEAAEAIGQKANMYFIPTRKKDFINVKSLIPSLRFYLERRFFKEVLFINQNTYFYAILKNAIDTPLQYCEVLYTHYVETDLSRSQQAELLGKLRKVFVYNSTIKEELVQYGVPREIIQVIYGAINRKIYYPQVQYDKSKFACLTPYILVVGHCKSRKNPDLIAKVINEMKSHQFVIHGTGWNEYFTKNSLSALPNLKLFSFNLEDNPEFMRCASTYLSLSTLEGGPFPTLEALASGTPVVVTDTGWNKEIVNMGNGIVLPINVSVFTVVQAITKTLRLKNEVRNQDLLKGKYKWEDYGRYLFKDYN